MLSDSKSNLVRVVWGRHMKKQKKIYIVDVTNRDGVQTSRLGLAKLHKTKIKI